MSIHLFNPRNFTGISWVKTKINNYRILKEIKKNFRDFNEYYILVASQNIYDEVRNSIALKDYTVLLRSVNLYDFNRNAYLNRKENLDSVISEKFYDKTSSWKIVHADIENENVKVAKIKFRFSVMDSNNKKVYKYIEFQRNFFDKLSDYDWKISKINI